MQTTTPADARDYTVTMTIALEAGGTASLPIQFNVQIIAPGAVALSGETDLHDTTDGPKVVL